MPKVYVHFIGVQIRYCHPNELDCSRQSYPFEVLDYWRALQDFKNTGHGSIEGTFYLDLKKGNKQFGEVYVSFGVASVHAPSGSGVSFYTKVHNLKLPENDLRLVCALLKLP